jgi:hypothetical protein
MKMLRGSLPSFSLVPPGVEHLSKTKRKGGGLEQCQKGPGEADWRNPFPLFLMNVRLSQGVCITDLLH